MFFSKEKIILLLVALGLFLTAYSSKNLWSEKMMNFVAPVTKIYNMDLNKDVYSEKEKETLRGAIKDLSNTTHGLKFNIINFFSKKDPAVKAEYDQFKNNLDMADKSLAFSTKQSIFYVKGAIGQCAACHAKGGKSTHLFDLFKETKISNFEKGRLALALRDYKSSAQIYKSMLLDKDLQGNYFKMNDIFVSYLNASVLDQAKSSEILKDINKMLPMIKNQVTKKELEEKIKDIKANEEISSYKIAIQKYKKIPQDFSEFDKKIYSALKIKNKLHEELTNVKTKEDRAEVYSVLGDIYSNYAALSIFMVPEAYYELCILEVPKAKLAQECFKKYSTQITLGYSGSMGTNVPAFELEKIEKLKLIAYPKGV